MGSSSEVGACNVNLDSYQCSFKEITVSTDWSTPGGLTSGSAIANIIDNNTNARKTLYVVSSPAGKKITVRTVREPGKCTREAHRMYRRKWDEYMPDARFITYAKVDGFSGGTAVNGNNQCVRREEGIPLSPFVRINNQQNKQSTILDQEQIVIKCFEIGGIFDTLNYFKLPIPTTPKQVSSVSYASCKQRGIGFDIITYPDVRFKIELTLGTKEAKKKTGGWSHFKSESIKLDTAVEKIEPKIIEAFGTKIAFYPPRVDAKFIYNGKQDELGFTLDFDTKKEIFSFHYKHELVEKNGPIEKKKSIEKKFGTEAIQSIPKALDKIKDLCDIISRIINMNFLDELKHFNPNNLRAYCPFEFKVNPTSFCLSVEGQYQTSQNLMRIGKVYDICLDADPLISMSLKIDLLYIILNTISAGAATGFYNMFKNFDSVIGKILGNGYKKKYNNAKPFSADVFFDLVITGSINGGLHLYIDTTEEKRKDSGSGSITGELKVDLKAGGNLSVNLYIIQIEGEASASATTGIKIKLGIEDRVKQGDGAKALFEIIFSGFKVTYCLKGKAGWFSTGKKDEIVICKDTTLLSASKVYLADKNEDNHGWQIDKKDEKQYNQSVFSGGNTFSAGGGGGGGGVRGL